MIPAPNPWLSDNGGEIFLHETIAGLAAALGVDAQNLTVTLEQSIAPSNRISPVH